MANKLPSSDKKENVAHSIRRCLNTVDGKIMLNYMEEMYNGDNLRGKDVSDTYYNLGQRDVMMQLKFISESVPK